MTAAVDLPQRPFFRLRGDAGMDWISIDWNIVVRDLLHLGAAYLIALPVAFDREEAAHGVGLRTFPLVAVAACGYTIVGFSMLDSTDAEARVLQGLITGIGFIGGGAILKESGSVRGTATAASIWTTGLIGIAVAGDRFEIATLLSLIMFITLRYVRSLQVNGSEGED
jgi:putative Mg2+ transporter-C (MgtC) family protein